METPIPNRAVGAAEQDRAVLRASQPHLDDPLRRAVDRRRPAKGLAEYPGRDSLAFGTTAEVAVGQIVSFSPCRSSGRAPIEQGGGQP